LPGSTENPSERAALGVVVTRRRREQLVVEQKKSLPISGSTLESLKRPTVVVGWEPSGESRLSVVGKALSHRPT